MHFQSQAEYVHYHSPEQRAMRSARAESERLSVVRNAQVLSTTAISPVLARCCSKAGYPTTAWVNIYASGVTNPLFP